MCFALLRVRYRTEASAELIEIKDEEQYAIKLESLRTSANVMSVETYRRSEFFKRQEMWIDHEGTISNVEGVR
jgi:hypothetical protein